jgi:hypothetical protein
MTPSLTLFRDDESVVDGRKYMVQHNLCDTCTT